MKKDYSNFTTYFIRRGFGTEMPVLTLFSYLPPNDRVEILRNLLTIDPTNVEIFNKLSMALLKSGKFSEAIRLLNDGFEQGIIDGFNYSAMKEKVEFLKQTKGNNFDSTVDYRQTIALIEQGKQILANIGWLERCEEFNNLVISFCNENIE